MSTHDEGIRDIGLAEIEAAAARIKGHVRRTPLVPVAPAKLTDSGAEIWLKADCLQVSGSFKARGAFNAVLSLTPEQQARGVVTASGGNFGAAIAYAGRELGLAANVIVMEGSTEIARNRIRSFGANLIVEGRHWDMSWDAGSRLAEETGATLLHPFADGPVIAGQGTIGLEILEDLPDVDTVVVSIGGGGLIAGIAAAIKQKKPGVRVVGVETVGCPTLHAARAAGEIVKFEEIDTLVPILGARTTEPVNFAMVERYVDELVLIAETVPAPAARWTWENTGLAIELGAASAVAAVREGVVSTSPGEKVAIVLCGSGNDGVPH